MAYLGIICLQELVYYFLFCLKGLAWQIAESKEEISLIYIFQNTYVLNLLSSRPRRIPRLNSPPSSLPRRRKEEVAARPRRRSGRKERSVTSWTTWCCSTRPPMTSCTRKCPHTSWSLPPSSVRGWRSLDPLLAVDSRNCLQKVGQTRMLHWFLLIYF